MEGAPPRNDNRERTRAGKERSGPVSARQHEQGRGYGRLLLLVLVSRVLSGKTLVASLVVAGDSGHDLLCLACIAGFDF